MENINNNLNALADFAIKAANEKFGEKLDYSKKGWKFSKTLGRGLSKSIQSS